MQTENPWRTGITAALTLAISYTVCALAYALWPEQGINFLNGLFHGLDFGKLVIATPFTFLAFFFPLLVLSIWGFAVGALFTWLHRILHGSSAEGR